MTNPTDWTYWLYAARLLGSVLVAAALMVHALVNARAAGVSSPGARRWAYALYAIMFLCVMGANLVAFGRTLAEQERAHVGHLRIGLFSLLVFGSYIPLLVRFRRPKL